MSYGDSGSYSLLRAQQRGPDPIGDILGSKEIGEPILSPAVIAQLIPFLQLVISCLKSLSSSNDNPSWRDCQFTTHGQSTDSEDGPLTSLKIPDEIEEITSKIRAKIDRQDSAVERFLTKHAIWEKERERLISDLQYIMRRVDEVHDNMGRSKVIGEGITLTGAIVAVGGLALIPFSGGLSATLMVGGAIGAVGGSAYNYKAASYEHGVSKTKCDEVAKLIKNDEQISDELNMYMKEALDRIADLKVEFDASKPLSELLKEINNAKVDLGASVLTMVGVFSTLSASPILQAELIFLSYTLVTGASVFKTMTFLHNIHRMYEESEVSKEIKQAISTLQEQVDKMNEVVIAIKEKMDQVTRNSMKANHFV